MAKSSPETLVQSLSSYVSGDDVGLDRETFLTYVRDRIDADLETLRREKQTTEREL